MMNFYTQFLRRAPIEDSIQLYIRSLDLNWRNEIGLSFLKDCPNWDFWKSHLKYVVTIAIVRSNSLKKWKIFLLIQLGTIQIVMFHLN
jgi:hypothetical protein